MQTPRMSHTRPVENAVEIFSRKTAVVAMKVSDLVI